MYEWGKLNIFVKAAQTPPQTLCADLSAPQGPDHVLQKVQRYSPYSTDWTLT